MLSYPIHERFPAVSHLEVHLPDEQRVYFQPDSVRNQMERSTTLLEFFTLCQSDAFTTTLLYPKKRYPFDPLYFLDGLITAVLTKIALIKS